MQQLEDVVRQEWGRLVALLLSQFRRLDLVEDALGDAVEAASRTWPVDGAPDKPAAWLLTAARRRVVDRLRTEEVARRKEPLLRTDAEHVVDDGVQRTTVAAAGRRRNEELAGRQAHQHRIGIELCGGVEVHGDAVDGAVGADDRTDRRVGAGDGGPGRHGDVARPGVGGDVARAAALGGMDAARAVARLAAHVLRILATRHQLGVGGIVETAGDILVALRAVLGADELRAGNLGRHHHRAIHHHAGDEQQSPEGRAAEDNGISGTTGPRDHGEID